MTPNVQLVRTWALLIFACIAIIYGLVGPDPTVLMLGFATLGGEPIARSVNGRTNDLPAR
jgi:hypothetical protein